MVSKDFKNILMFNGEIFNHQELRKDMESVGIEFETDHSDTEVILNGISNFGIDYISKLNGQFSISFFDLENDIIYLIRDSWVKNHYSTVLMTTIYLLGQI